MTNEQTNLKALSEQLLQLANDEGTAQIHDVAIQIAAVTDKMRNAVIEECAKIADDEQARAAERQKIETEKNGNIIYGLPGILAALIATRIRQLKYALPQPAQSPAVTNEGAISVNGAVSVSAEKCQFDETFWRAVALRRFGPIPPGADENARLIAGYHYAFIEGAKAALATPSLPQAPAVTNDAVELISCPFCGSEDIDAEFWASAQYYGPGCNECGATAETPEKWNVRVPTKSAPPILTPHTSGERPLSSDAAVGGADTVSESTLSFPPAESSEPQAPAVTKESES